MTMDIDKHGSVPFEIARRLAQYQANRLAIFEWIEPGWLVGAPANQPDASGANFARLRADAVHAWLDQAGAPLPAFHAFRSDDALLGALSLDDALGALCLRALYFRRAELRYWVDRESREKVASWLGRRGAAALRWLIGTPHAPALDRLIRDHGMSRLERLDDYALSWEGYCLFTTSGLCGAATPAGLLRFAWPRDAEAPRWLGAQDLAAHRDDSARVMRRLADFYTSGHDDPLANGSTT